MASGDQPVRYTVTAAYAVVPRVIARPDDAARLFYDIDANKLPAVTKVSADGEVSTLATTSSLFGRSGTTYEKSVTSADQAFYRAYMALVDPARASADQMGNAEAGAAYLRVERDAMERTQAQEWPSAVVLGGQPGSGKSVLAGEAIRELRKRGGAVLIDADRMREEHPLYKQLMAEDPLNAADRTQQQAGAWASRLRNAAIEGKRNLVIDGTMRSTENIRSMVERLRRSGYEIDARVMAVSAQTSLTRARLRYEEQAAVRGFGRFVNAEQHDRAYEALPDSVAMLERDMLVDRIRVYNARQESIYGNRLEQGTWRQAPGAAAALHRERAREWDYKEHRDYVAALEQTSALVRQRTSETDRLLESALDSARDRLASFPQSSATLRAEAFERMDKKRALALYPELDGAYAQLRQLRHDVGPSTGAAERDQMIADARVRIAGELERGAIPAGAVTLAESEQVIGLAAAQRGIKSLRAAGQLQRDIRGEVSAVSTHHVLVALSSDVAVRLEKANLDRQVEQGDRIHVRYRDSQREVHVIETAAKDPGRNLGREYGQ